MGISVTATEEGITFIRRISGERDTGVIHAFRMLRTADGLGAFIGAGPLCDHTLIGRTREMGIAVAAANEGITFIARCARNGNTCALRTRQVCHTFRITATCVGTGAVNRETLCPLALSVLPWGTTKGRITIILTFSNEDNALCALAFRVLIAADLLGTLIGSVARDHRTLIPIAGEVLAAETATEQRIAFIRPHAEYGEALFTLADRVLVASDEW